MPDIIEKGFGPNMMQSDVRFLHEREGVRLSREVLAKTGWPEDVIAAVGEIIDGHDTRPQPRSLNDRLVRDCRQAVALHRHRRRGRLRLVQDDAAPICRSTGQSSFRLGDRGRTRDGRGELAATRAALMLHLI